MFLEKQDLQAIGEDEDEEKKKKKKKVTNKSTARVIDSRGNSSTNVGGQDGSRPQIIIESLAKSRNEQPTSRSRSTATGRYIQQLKDEDKAEEVEVDHFTPKEISTANNSLINPAGNTATYFGSSL